MQERINPEILVKVEGVRKKFCRSLKRSLWYGLKDMAAEMLGGAAAHDVLRPHEFWAVDGVSFELRRGECLGLIGRNGAGKTTLLKILNGLIKPDAGRVTMRGQVGALIALGAGFNPILSGRENIYVNGSVLGLSKREIESRIDGIIDFADIREFIDAPVQSYSSGMQVRLGFAVATAMKPDVLLLDEVLAVGDAAFRNKCYRRVIALRKEAAVIFVSHSMEQVARVSDRVLVMSRGRAIYLGDVSEGVEAYEGVNEEGEDKDRDFLSIHDPLTGFEVILEEKELNSGWPLGMIVRISSLKPIDKFQFRVAFYNPAGAFAAYGFFPGAVQGIRIEPGMSEWSVTLDSVPLKRGRYRMAFSVTDKHGDMIVWSYKQHEVRVRDTYLGSLADCQLKLKSWVQTKTQAVPH